MLVGKYEGYTIRGNPSARRVHDPGLRKVPGGPTLNPYPWRYNTGTLLCIKHNETPLGGKQLFLGQRSLPKQPAHKAPTKTADAQFLLVVVLVGKLQCTRRQIQS